MRPGATGRSSGQCAARGIAIERLLSVFMRFAVGVAVIGTTVLTLEVGSAVGRPVGNPIFTVPALSPNWLDTGLNLTAGQTVTLAVIGGDATCSAPGSTDCPVGGLATQPPCPQLGDQAGPGLSTFPVPDVVGKIGSNGTPFEIPTGGGVHATGPGELFLIYNDCDPPQGYANNAGSMQVAVTTPSSVSATLHIGEATADLSQGLARAARALKPQAASLVREKDALVADIPGLTRRLEQADAKLAQLDGAIPALTRQVAQTQALAAQALAAQRASADAAVAAQRDSLDREMASLQEQILDAIRSLSPETVVDALIAHYNADQSELDGLERTLAGKEPKADGLDQSWIAKLRALEQRLAVLQREQARAESDRWVAADELDFRRKRVDEIDSELTALAARAATLDLGLKTVTVYADGKAVFEAEFNRDIPELTALDAQIEEAQQQLGLLYEKRVDARTRFLVAQQAATEALDNVTSTIMSTAGKKAGVDFVYNVYDVIMAGRKGGLLGAASETLKKAGETIAKEGPPWNWFSARSSGGGAPELDAFDKDYDALFTGLMSSGTAAKVAKERLAKQEITKPIKDYANQTLLAPLYEKLWGLQLKPEAKVTPPNLTMAFKEFIASFSDAESHLDSLKKGVKLNPLSGIKSISDLKGIAGSPLFDLVGSYLKDVSKELAKSYLDVSVQSAFANYFVQETVARAYFPLWALANDRYWDTEAHLQDLLDQKAALVAKGYNPETKVRTTLDETFPKTATLVITVTSTGAGLAKGAIQLDAKVHGKEAKHTGTTRFTISAAGLGVSDGALGLELFAH